MLEERGRQQCPGAGLRPAGGMVSPAGGEQRHLSLRLAGGPHPQGVAPQHRLPPVYRHHQHPLRSFQGRLPGGKTGVGRQSVLPPDRGAGRGLLPLPGTVHDGHAHDSPCYVEQRLRPDGCGSPHRAFCGGQCLAPQTPAGAGHPGALYDALYGLYLYRPGGLPVHPPLPALLRLPPDRLFAGAAGGQHGAQV